MIPGGVRLRRLVGVLGCIGIGALSSCAIGVEGDFDGVPFLPGPTVVAVADRNELLLHNGAVVRVGRVEADERIHMLFTAAPVDADRHWAGAPADVLRDVTHALATHDGLLLQDLPLARFARGDRLSAVLEGGVLSGDFVFGVGMVRPALTPERALGSRVRLTVQPRGVELSRRGGSVAGDITIVREREAGQDADAATGRFTLRFSASFGPERLTEANLAVASSVLGCMQAVGPGRSASCGDVSLPPVVDETGPGP